MMSSCVCCARLARGKDVWKMGVYLNPGTAGFRTSLNSQIYVDKSGLIEKTNALIGTQQKFVCVSRPRRFGKSMAAEMLAAYYDRSADASELFEGLKIAKAGSYSKHLNKYDVIKVNMQEFLSIAGNIDEMLKKIKSYVIFDLLEEYENVKFRDEENLYQVMKDIFAKTKIPFVILIDEWDCIFREYKNDLEAQKKYLDFIRSWLKDQSYVALAYMTGILPIKKYGTHSALNMFSEYSMLNAREMTDFFGFTENEVRELCDRYGRSFEEAKGWYDGYTLFTMEKNDGKDELKEHSIYSPKSLVDAMLSGMFDNYWNKTETYEALKIYIQMNFDGLKDAVIRMLAGESVQINTETFTNDMTTFNSRDDVLTLLVHLGYLTYNWPDRSVSIPNKEVSQEFVNAISTMDWQGVAESVAASRKLLESLWNMDGDAVAAGLEKAHQEIAILQYNDENSLSCVINLAFYFAREYYTIIREMPAGKGFADICLIPRRLHADKPAAVIELKYDKSAEGAIAQIKEKNYTEALADYHGNLLLAGINYDKDTKAHTCVIEKMEK